MKKILATVPILLLCSCSVEFKDNRLDVPALSARLERLDHIDMAIVGKLKELQDKGYLEKPKNEKPK